jgi:hypothetical protein
VRNVSAYSVSIREFSGCAAPDSTTVPPDVVTSGATAVAVDMVRNTTNTKTESVAVVGIAVRH